MNTPKEPGITRRDFMKTAGIAGAALTASSVVPSLARKAFAAKRDYVLIGHPNPSTGPLADFGEASPWADNKAVEAMNKLGGVYIEELGKSVPVKLKLIDTESNPTKAAELASKLIIKDKVDMMVVMHTPDTVNPVSSVCERYGVPCVSLDAPVDAWMSGGPYKWCFHVFWRADSLIDLYISMWDEVSHRTNRVVGGLWPNDADGSLFADLFAKRLPASGYNVVDPGRFPFFTKDFSTFINRFKKEKVDILMPVMIPPDWITVWRQCHQQGFIPKIATVAKALLFPSAVGALGGNLPNGLTVEIWWSPYHPFKSSLTGQTCRELCEAWEKENGKQWSQPMGYKYAGFEIAYDALKRARSFDKEKIRKALEQTDLNTVVGPVKFNSDHYSEVSLAGGQWVKGKKWPWELEIVHNKMSPFIPKTANMIFPLPK